MPLPDWWVYIIMAVSVFLGCLLLNYIVNKINEVQLEERLIALQLKSPEGRVTQVQVPLLETGEITQARYPLPTIKKSEPTHEIKTVQRSKETFPISESQIEKIISKPIFLGSIYRSTELIERRSSNGDIGKTYEKPNTELDEYCYRFILNELLDRVMAITDSAKLQNDSMKKFEIVKSNDESNDLETITLNAGARPDITNDSIIVHDLLDNVMLKVNKND